jgi:hypothetical protein
MKNFNRSILTALILGTLTASAALADQATGQMGAKGDGKSVNCPSLASNADKGGGQSVDSTDPKASPAPAAAGQGK